MRYMLPSNVTQVITLLPPAAHVLGLYPTLHQYYRQLQHLQSSSNTPHRLNIIGVLSDYSRAVKSARDLHGNGGSDSLGSGRDGSRDGGDKDSVGRGGGGDGERDGVNDDADEESLPFRIFEITANRGDVLYIPPYWFHLVSTPANSSDGAIALNVWSPSKEHLATEEFAALPIPFELEWGAPALKVAAVVYFNLLLNLAFGDDDADDVDANVDKVAGDGEVGGGKKQRQDDGAALALLGLRRRYDYEGVGTTIHNKQTNNPDDGSSAATAASAATGRMRNCGSLDSVPFQHDALVTLLQQRARQAAVVLRQIESHAIRAISLANFAEEVARMVLLDDTELPGFMPCLWEKVN